MSALHRRAPWLLPDQIPIAKRALQRALANIKRDFFKRISAPGLPLDNYSPNVIPDPQVLTRDAFDRYIERALYDAFQGAPPLRVTCSPGAAFDDVIHVDIERTEHSHKPLPRMRLAAN